MTTTRAMKAAVEMEIHAACSTTTKGKAEALEKHFPAYDELLQSTKDLVKERDEGTLISFATVESARAAVAKAEGRSV